MRNTLFLKAGDLAPVMLLHRVRKQDATGRKRL